MTVDLIAADRFMRANARLLEQHVYGCTFGGGSSGMVVASLNGYRNPDGGFGHGLEPDKRAPGSQPLDVEIALERLVWSGAPAADMVIDAVDWLEGRAVDGLVPVLLSTIAGYPRAAHWSYTDEYLPSVNPTASIAAHLHRLGVQHSFVDLATDACFRTVEEGSVPDEAHDLLCLTRLANDAPDRRRATAVAKRLAEAIPTARFVQMEPADDSYGVTPLDFAPDPGHVARSWFDDRLIEGHLDALAGAQQPDGGWPVVWEPPSQAALWEWRGIRTLAALRVLAAYGRIS